MSNKKNIIKLTGDRNIIIQDANSRDIIIKQNDPQLFVKLQVLNNEQITVIQQMINEQNDKFSAQLKTIISGIASQKNIVQNSTINAKSVKIGDTVEYHYHYESPKIKKHIGYIPTKPAVFLGRDQSPEDIHKKLNNNNNLLLLVNGEGGIGKTTLAAEYYHRYKQIYSHLIWLVAENGIKDALKSLAIHLKLTFAHDTTEEQQLELIIAEIINLDKPVLLIFDNANSFADLESSYATLRKLPNTHILMTSRINNFDEIENFKVPHLTKEFAVELFKRYYKAFKNEETPLLEKILEAVRYNTLIIELLAKNLNKFNDEHETDYPLQKLLEDIQQKGMLALNYTDEIQTDYMLEKAKPEEIVLAMFDIANLEPAQKKILSVFSVLPPVAVSYTDLKLFLPETNKLSQELIKLQQEGWCDYDKEQKAYKLNPVIAEVTRKKNKESIKQDISGTINTLAESLDYTPGIGHIEGDFEQISRFVSYAENIVVYIDFIDSSQYYIFERIGNFYQTYGNLDKALKFFEEETQLFEEVYESQPQNVGFKNGLAISYEKLGDTHSSLGNLDKALKFFEERSRLGKELYENQPDNVEFKNNLAISYLKLGDTHSSLGNLEKALKFFEEETQLFEELYESQPQNVGFKNGLAISYVKLGLYFNDKNTKKALEYFEQAKQHFKELYENFPAYKEFKDKYYSIIDIIEQLKQ